MPETLLDDPATDGDDDGLSSWRDAVPPIDGWLARIGLVLLGLEAIVGIWLRFSSSPLLWLDEALTVNIAKLPLGQLHAALKEDGAPPLYYLLLHFWMLVFGRSDFAVRSLSGVFSCATLVVVFVVVRRIWGRELAFLSLAILLASSFATYYATETRMYAWVMFLVALGALFLQRLFECPTWSRAVPFALVLVGLEYSHYWSIYLFITVAVWFVFVALWARRAAFRRAALFGLGSFAAAGLCFLPWLPTFSYQQKHTGTPWGGAPNFKTAVVAVFHYNLNQASQIPKADLGQRGVELLMILLMGLALFVATTGPWRFSLRLRGQPRALLVAWLSLGTVVLGVLASHFSGAAFVPRYASVAYLPLVVFLALGTRAIWQPWLRVLLVGLMVLGTLFTGFEQHGTPRTEAGKVVSILDATAPAGSLVVFCPDQLGPSVMRILPSGEFTAVGYPRLDDPHYVNWVDYNDALAKAARRLAHRPLRAVDQLASKAGGKPIFLVSALGYEHAGDLCTTLRTTLDQHMDATTLLKGNGKIYFQSMTLTEYRARSSSSSSDS